MSEGWVWNLIKISVLYFICFLLICRKKDKRSNLIDDCIRHKSSLSERSFLKHKSLSFNSFLIWWLMFLNENNSHLLSNRRCYLTFRVVIKKVCCLFFILYKTIIDIKKSEIKCLDMINNFLRKTAGFPDSSLYSVS